MDLNVQMLGMGWLLMAPFVWFTLLARRTFRFPSIGGGGPGVMLAGWSILSGIVLAIWAGQHGSSSAVLQAAGVLIAICSVALYESARRIVTGRGFGVALSGDVPPAVCSQGPYRYVRHPVYASYVLAFLAIFVAAPGTATGIGFAINFAFFALVAMTEELTIARSAIGAAYVAYRRTTGMFLPKVGL